MNIIDFVNLVSKDKREEARVKAVQRFVVGIGIAGVVGVATGLLFAPKSGKETRIIIKEKGIDTLENIKDTVRMKVDTVKDVVDHAVKDVENFSNELNKAVK